MTNGLLFTLFALLQCIDLYTTYTIIKTGKGYEANPFLAWIFDRIGYVAGLLIFKGLAIAIGLFVVQFWNGYYVLAPLIALYTWVVYNNYKVLNK
jgi:hypothetical protein